MDIEIRVPQPHEIDGWLFAEASAFGGHPDPAAREPWASLQPTDRLIAAFDGDRVVGTASAYPFDMTVPGGAGVPVAGVSSVAVVTTHRRRGILTEMMRFQLDEVAARGEPAAILNASETAIYPRFGYGLASSYQGLVVTTLRSAFARPLDVPGELELVPKAQAHGPLAAVWEHCRAATPGEVTRTEAWWKVVLGDQETWKGGGKWFVLVHTSPDGQPDGSVLYTVTHADMPGTWKLSVREMTAVDPLVRALLWRTLLDTDLIGTVEFPAAPLDDPLRWWLADVRQARVDQVLDYLWVRPLDVPAYLSARVYGGDDAVVVEVVDRFRPQTDGSYRISPGGAGPGTCERTDDQPDLVLGVEDIGSLSLGGVTATTLAHVGRIAERRPGALATADRLFASPVAPFCATRF